MKLIIFLLYILCVSIRVQCNDPTSDLPGVIDLTPENFDKIIDGRKSALVEFYAPWCGHCKSLVPEYRSLGEKIKNDPNLSSKVIIGKVNANDHKSLGTRFGIKGYPTLKWFSRGKSPKEPEAYSGGRTAIAMLGYIKEKLESDPHFARISELDEIAKAFLKGDIDKAIENIEEKIKSYTNEDDIKNASLYLAAMKKAKDKGNTYFSSEHGRLNRIIDSNSVTSDKIAEMTRKVSVLSAFVET